MKKEGFFRHLLESSDINKKKGLKNHKKQAFWSHSTILKQQHL